MFKYVTASGRIHCMGQSARHSSGEMMMSEKAGTEADAAAWQQTEKAESSPVARSDSK